MNFYFTYILTGPLAWQLECSPIARKTGIQSQVESYQRHKKWYLMLPCLTLCIIRYGSRIKWTNPGEGEAPFHTSSCNRYWKSSLRVTHWPSTEPSIKRCTSVNKRKNSGSRWTSNTNITGTQTAWVSWSWSQLGTSCRIESQPSVTHGWATQPRWERNTAGSICSSLSPSPTHLSHTTNINPFEKKVWDIYFYKKVCLFVHWSRRYCLIMHIYQSLRSGRIWHKVNF